jgi:hypothetical protein
MKSKEGKEGKKKRKKKERKKDGIIKIREEMKAVKV